MAFPCGMTCMTCMSYMSCMSFLRLINLFVTQKSRLPVIPTYLLRYRACLPYLHLNHFLCYAYASPCPPPFFFLFSQSDVMFLNLVRIFMRDASFLFLS